MSLRPRANICDPQLDTIRLCNRIEPLEVEQWLRALKKEEDLANPTLDKTRRVMSFLLVHPSRPVEWLADQRCQHGTHAKWNSLRHCTQIKCGTSIVAAHIGLPSAVREGTPNAKARRFPEHFNVQTQVLPLGFLRFGQPCSLNSCRVQPNSYCVESRSRAASQLIHIIEQSDVAPKVGKSPEEQGVLPLPT
jgi:hypothetical protein